MMNSEATRTIESRNGSEDGGGGGGAEEDSNESLMMAKRMEERGLMKMSQTA